MLPDLKTKHLGIRLTLKDRAPIAESSKADLKAKKQLLVRVKFEGNDELPTAFRIDDLDQDFMPSDFTLTSEEIMALVDKKREERLAKKAPKLSPLRKQLMSEIYDGGFLVLTSNFHGRNAYKTYDKARNPLRYYDKRTVSGVFKTVLVKGPDNQYTLDGLKIEEMTGNSAIKKHYLSLKNKQNGTEI